MAKSQPIKEIPETDVKKLSSIWTGRDQLKRPAISSLRPIHALDTETYDGNIFLIADSDGRYLDKITLASILDFLYDRKYENAWNFFYGLEYDAGVILKMLGQELNKYLKTHLLSFEFEDYLIYYVPKKCLRITKGHHSVSFFDIAQFYQDSLLDAYANNIGQPEKYAIELKGKREEFSPRFYRRNTSLIRKYCINDCMMTKKLSEKFITLFHEAFGFYCRRWISSGNLAEKVMINRHIHFPRYLDISEKIQDLAYRSYFGGRFEITKRGFIGTAYLYDLNSAYPHKIANLPDLTNGKWVMSKEINPEARIGFFKILADIPEDSYLAPFPFRANNAMLFPSGKFITYCTLDELLACEDTSYYKILESYQFVPKEQDFLPYLEEIQAMYQQRLTLKKSKNPLQLPIKLILSSIYGKTGEVIRRRGARVIGNLFNPVIFAHITGATRAQLYSFIRRKGFVKNVVGTATDSVCTTRMLSVDSEELGAFSFKKSANDVFFLQNGIYRFNGQWSKRGIGKLVGKSLEHIDTVEKNGKLFIKLQVLRSIQLRSAIIQNRICDIGKIKPVVRQIDPNADRKRFWNGTIESINAKQFNDSSSFSLTRFPKSSI